MWQPDESTLVKFHIAGSIATLVCCASILLISFLPQFSPEIYRLLADFRIISLLPYLLFIALGESLFSIWYFLFRNRK